jgi:uncharacterized protein (DUF2252 family)
MSDKAKPVRPKDRARVLEQCRRRKMARSAHSYVRGSALKFYEWLESGARLSLPEGPAVWICGDAHVSNLGPIANSERQVAVQVRDLDQTVVGNPAHDLVRLGLSLGTAARGSDLPGVTTAHILEHIVVGYERALLAPHTEATAKDGNSDSINHILKHAIKRRWRDLAEERIEDVSPTIPLGRRFWSLSSEERAAINDLFTHPEVQTLMTHLSCDSDQAKVKVLDAAYWMKGCSSLGRLRFAVLIGIGPKGKQRFALIDIKEAVRAVAPSVRHLSKREDFAARVVTGARALSPYLGERMIAATLLRKPVFLRELMPQDLKLEFDRLARSQAAGVAEYLANVLGKAHARQMDAKTRKVWRAELDRNRSKSLDAPSWLWRAVVELIATHEVAYLEHCRRYVLEGP